MVNVSERVKMSSGFISEKELEERRLVRQKEWEKVRQPNQPLEAPEEPYDPKSLYERLEEQKQLKQQEYEEAHRLKNMVKGLDDDEIEFLDLVDKKKIEAEQLKEWEEQQELLDFRKKVEKLKESALDQRIQYEIHPTKLNSVNSSSIKSQHNLLKGVVIKRKKSNELYQKINEGNSQNKSDSEELENKDCRKKKKLDNAEENQDPSKVKTAGMSLNGLLPGLGSYMDSSDDEDENGS